MPTDWVGTPTLTADRDGSRDLLEARAMEAFGFLIESDGLVSQESDAQLSRLRFVLASTFVEVELDWREKSVFVLVGDLPDGDVPTGYYVDSSGRKVRWHLGEVLGRSGHEESSARLRQATKKSGRQTMVEQIELSAQVLKPIVGELPSMIQNMAGH